MRRRTLVAMALGAGVGAVAGLAILALTASRLLDGGLGAVLLDQASGRSRPEFLVSQGGLYLLVILSGLVAGALLGALGAVVAREADPEAPRVPLGAMTVVGGISSAVVGFAVSRALVALTADISGGMVTISVFRGVVVALAAGAATGLVVGGAVERLSRSEIYGFEGAARPAGAVALARDAAVAVGLPVVALAGGALIVWGLSQVLLEASTTVSLVVFGAAATLVLAVAAYVAAHPPQRGDDG